MERLSGLFRFWLALCCILPSAAWAGLASHEVLVLVNRQSLRSMQVANHFVQIRQIPARNVLYLDLPDHVLEPRAEITPEEFTRHIWEPAQATLKERELDGHVLAWIYSVDFPIRITTAPPVSLMGMTFLRNRFPDDPEVIEKGLYFSRLFAGPDTEDGGMALGASLVRYWETLAETMPVPSMMLGFTGSRGTDTETVIRTLRYGQVADRSSPRGTVYWVTGEDVRAEIRAWQFPIAQQELRRLGVRSDVSGELGRDVPGIIGLQCGVQGFHAEQVGRHLPGSMAEHLTSHGASFHLPFQTKLTDWIRAGATASAGTVTEPYALWPKFPHARFFAHYARGNSMLESFYLSLRSPTQILLVGEPLSRPWSPPLTLSLISLDDEPLKETAHFMLAVFPEVPNARMNFRIFHNGAFVAEGAEGPGFSFNTSDMADGYHELRAVSYAQGPLVHTVMNRIGIRVSNHGRAVRVHTPHDTRDQDLYEPLLLDAESDGDPVRLQVVHNERVLAEAEGGTARFQVDPMVLGPGPVRVQIRAVYEDDMEVYSDPLDLVVKRIGRHPVLRVLEERDAAGRRTTPDWEEGRAVGAIVDTLRDRGAHIKPEPKNEYGMVLFAEKPGVMRSYSARVTVPDIRTAHPQTEQAGLVFSVRDEKNFDYFIMNGSPSAWTFGRCRNGRMEHQVERGALMLRATPQDIDLLFNGTDVRAFVNGEPTAAWTTESATKGAWGVLVSERGTQFEQVKIEAGDAHDVTE